MKKTLLTASALLLAATAIVAQGPGQSPGQVPDGPPPHHGPPGPPAEFMGGMEHRTITGAPFSAQLVSTSTQTLSDGSHIARNINASIARDSQGRTYRQESANNKTMVFLHDPVAHTSHVISVESKTAVVSRMPPPHMMPDGAHGPRGPHGPPPNGDGPQAEGRVAPPHHNNEVVESLGSQMMEGVWAEGTRVTHTIAAGAIGNDHELKTVSETWYSKDLQTVVMSKRSDPRMGESTFRLTNIQRAEPDATLFQVPAGVKVTEQMHGRR